MRTSASVWKHHSYANNNLKPKSKIPSTSYALTVPTLGGKYTVGNAFPERVSVPQKSGPAPEKHATEPLFALRICAGTGENVSLKYQLGPRQGVLNLWSYARLLFRAD